MISNFSQALCSGRKLDDEKTIASPVDLKNIRFSTDDQARNSDYAVSVWETHL